MSEHREEHLDLCAGWALSCLDDADTARLEAHLAQPCEACETALREFGDAAALLAAAAPITTPPPGLKERVLAAARADRTGRTAAPAVAAPPPPRVVPIAAARARRTAAIGWLAAAVCAGLLVWTGTAVVRLRQHVAARDAQIAQLERDRIALEERLADANRWVGVMTAAGARIAVLQPTQQGDAALRGRAIVDPASQRAVVALDHATPPAGRDYELWSIRGGHPRSLGVIRADAGGHALLQVEIGDAAALQALAVSLEPAGGSPTKDAPTGPVVMLGMLGG